MLALNQNFENLNTKVSYKEFDLKDLYINGIISKDLEDFEASNISAPIWDANEEVNIESPSQHPDKNFDYFRYKKDIELPPGVKAEFKLILLENGLEVLLVSQPTVDYAAVSLDVAVGSQSDPKNIQGLAHFLEHLIMMGSARYPSENGYSEFIQNRGGTYNAFTYPRNTNYHFSIGAEYLVGAIDRFAPYFVSPLFDKGSMDRELNAVENEFSMTWSDEEKMAHFVRIANYAPGHTHSNFVYGNFRTLKEEPEKEGIEVHKEIVDFYKKHYSANLMKLTVVGKQSIAELLKLVVPRFSTIPNLKLLPDEPTQACYQKEQLQKIIKYNRFSGIHKLEIDIPLTYRREFEYMPLEIIKKLISYNGPGSLLNLLQERSLASFVTLEVIILSRASSTLRMEVNLIPEAFEQFDITIGLIFQYFNFLKVNGVPEWYHKEHSDIEKLKNNYGDIPNSIDIATTLSNNLQFSIQRSFMSTYVFQTKYDGNMVKEILEEATLDRAVIYLSKEYDGFQKPKKEPYYGYEFEVKNFDEGFIQRIKELPQYEGFQLPEPNQYIPTDFDIVKVSSPFEGKNPHLLHSVPRGDIWYQRGSFSDPLSRIKIIISSTQAFSSLKNVTLNKLLIPLIFKQFSPIGYSFSDVGYGLNFSFNEKGIELEATGYSHRKEELVNIIVDFILSKEFGLNENFFELTKNNLLCNLNNHYISSPLDQLDLDFEYAMFKQSNLPFEEYEILDSLQFSDLEEYVSSMFSDAHLLIMISGNSSPKESLNLGLEIFAKFDQIQAKTIPREKLDLFKPVKMTSPKCEFVFQSNSFDEDQINNAIFYSLQVGPTSDHLQYAKLLLLKQLIREPFYAQLRTKEQLSYFLDVSLQDDVGLCLVFTILSGSSPVYLEGRIDEFLKCYAQILFNLKEQTFQELIQSLIEILSSKHNSFSEEAEFFEAIVESRLINFNYESILIPLVKSLTKKDICEFFQNFVCPGGNTRKKLSLHYFSKNFLDNNPNENEDNWASEEDGQKGVDENVEQISQSVIVEPIHRYENLNEQEPEIVEDPENIYTMHDFGEVILSLGLWRGEQKTYPPASPYSPPVVTKLD